MAADPVRFPALPLPLCLCTTLSAIAEHFGFCLNQYDFQGTENLDSSTHKYYVLIQPLGIIPNTNFF